MPTVTHCVILLKICTLIFKLKQFHANMNTHLPPALE